MCLYEVLLKPNKCFCPLWTELISGGLKVSHRQDLCPDGTLRADQFQFLLLLWSTTVKHLVEKNCFFSGEKVKPLFSTQQLCIGNAVKNVINKTLESIVAILLQCA